MKEAHLLSKNSSLDDIKGVLRGCLNQLYDEDAFLFARNLGGGICERSLVFRFAHHLQNTITNYFVDCDFNSSFEISVDSNGNICFREMSGKEIQNQDGTVTSRLIDIIVHKRDFREENDFICFEIKKWDNQKLKAMEKDVNNLGRLTSVYGYLYGFHLRLGRIKSQTRWSIFQAGQVIENNVPVFLI